MVWLIPALILTLFLLVPLKLHIRFHNNARVWLNLGPIQFALYPSKKRKTGKKSNKESENFASHEKAKKQRQFSKEDFTSGAQLVFEFLKDFKTKLRVDNLQLKITLADDDPCDLSVNYGRSWAALGNIYPYLERYFVIKNRKIEIACDYTADETVVDASVDLSITVARILHLAVYHGFKVLRKYIKLQKYSKDGAAL